MIVCISDILEHAELREVQKLISSGTFVDGASTAGYRAQRVKQNTQLEKTETAADVKSILLKALKRDKTFQRVAQPRTIRPPLISRYEPGMEYGLHVDDALMGPGRSERSDVSVTIFLNDPGDYDGGELLSHSMMGPQEVKLPAGSAVIYPSSSLHRVLPVTRGQRLVAVTWVQSILRDLAKREVIHDLDRIREHLHKVSPDSEETDLAFKSYANLLRMWADE